jgi:hypothetical protein
MMRKATASEVRTVLRERASDLRAMLGEPEAQLSFPTDGAGVRILARLPHPPNAALVTLRLVVNDLEVEIPVHLSGEFRRFHATA